MTTMSESHMRLYFFSLILFCCVSPSRFFTLKNPVVGLVGCRPHQIRAFTQFKNEFDTRHCNHSDDSNGVRCNKSTGAVTMLRVKDCLSGTLKPNSSLFVFHQLRYVDFTRNNFTSASLPSEFGNLKQLEVLILYSNGFIGQVPSSISNLRLISYLDLSHNELSGSFPLVRTLSKLTVLSLSHNHFSGSLSPKSSLFGFHQLCYLDLSYNKFTSSSPHSEFGNLNKLEFLGLSSNDFFGRIPPTFSNLTWLTKLYLDQNKLSGSFPLVQTLTKLFILVLSNNHFTGSPEILVNSTSMRILLVDKNRFEGALPNLPLSIEFFSAEYNSFTGEIPLSICNRSSLAGLELSNNNFTGPIPQYLSNFNYVSLRKNNLNGSIPDAFYVSASLRTLDVAYNRLIGKLPSSLLNCSSLKFLSVDNNIIEDTFPFWLKALPNLQVLILSLNKFYGPISPPHQGPLRFPELRIFEIFDNKFTGSLPPSYFVNWKLTMNKDGGLYMLYEKNPYGIVSYTYTDYIDLQYKGLSMEHQRILTSYAAIDFSGNRLEGHIPESIGLLKALIALNLSNNAFTGHIPLSFANLKELESLDLSKNYLSGTIPNGLGNLSFLEYINVSHNQLKGEIPQGTQITGQPKSSFEGNVGLCGLPLEEICFGSNAPPTQQPKEEDKEEEQLLNWKAVAIGYGSGVLFGLVVAQVIASYKLEWLAKIICLNKRINH